MDDTMRSMFGTRRMAEVGAEVRAACDHFRAVEARGEAFVRDADDLPVRTAEWMRWYDEEHRPASARFDEALLALETTLGEVVPGRNPALFVEVCRALLAATDDP
ncbi:MAG: hypothetical protein ACRCYQ_08500 [Nocardioides sp.]